MADHVAVVSEPSQYSHGFWYGQNTVYVGDREEVWQSITGWDTIGEESNMDDLYKVYILSCDVVGVDWSEDSRENYERLQEYYGQAIEWYGDGTYDIDLSCRAIAATLLDISFDDCILGVHYLNPNIEHFAQYRAALYGGLLRKVAV